MERLGEPGGHAREVDVGRRIDLGQALGDAEAGEGAHRDQPALDRRRREPALALEGGWLVLEEVQRTGSRRLGGRDFLNGLHGDLSAAALA